MIGAVTVLVKFWISISFWHILYQGRVRRGSVIFKTFTPSQPSLGRQITSAAFPTILYNVSIVD